MALLGNAGILISRAVELLVSISDTESEWLLVAANRDSSGFRASIDGAKPTSTLDTLAVSASITLTVPDDEDPVTGSLRMAEPLLGAMVAFSSGRRPPRLDTNTLPCFFEYATA